MGSERTTVGLGVQGEAPPTGEVKLRPARRDGGGVSIEIHGNG